MTEEKNCQKIRNVRERGRVYVYTLKYVADFGILSDD